MLPPGLDPTFVAFFLHTLLGLMWYKALGAEGGRGAGQQDCPRSCFCNKMSKIVYCSRRGLPFIPSGIPAHTLELNLNGNVFKTTAIQRSNFSELPDLEHLYMSECGIEEIEVDTFRDLINLKWLDLSNNRIKVIQSNTFRGLTLRHLFLNGNRHLELGEASFEGLVTSGLYLHDCSLTKLLPEILAPLNSTLGYLWLNGNALETVDRKFLSIFTTLSHLRLGSNPLHCNCEVVWLKEFFDKNGEVFEGAIPPSCLTPQRLKGKFFNELSLFDLRCQPPVFNNIDALFDTGHGKLRCAASGDPAPTLYWIQPTGRTTRYPAPPEEDARKNSGVLELRPPGGPGTDMSGMFICVANNEAGNVTFTINVSLPNAATRAGGAFSQAEVTYHTLGGDDGGDIGDEEEEEEGDGEGEWSPPSSRPPQPPSIMESYHSTPRPDVGRMTPLVVAPTERPDPSQPTSTPRSQRDQRRVYVPASSSDTGGGGGGGGSHGGAAATPAKNFTGLTMFELSRRRGERMFNLTELIGAVIGTHVCTLLLCLIFTPIYYKRKLRQQHSTNSLDKKKPPPSETLYLNGHHHPMDYRDTPSTSPKR